MRTPSYYCFASVFIIATSVGIAANSPKTVLVSAGDYERTQVIVDFAWPPSLPAPHFVRDEQGKLLPVQLDPQGQAAFRIEHLAKGARAKYRLVSDSKASATPSPLSAERKGTQLKIGTPNQPLLAYHAEADDLPRPDIKSVYSRGGYLEPVLTLRGKRVTDDFPPNHIHHHGLWWSWAKTQFEGREPDFWNMGDAKGRVEFVALDHSWAGPVHAGFISRHRYIDSTAPTPVTVLHEIWRARVFAPSPEDKVWIFDLECTDTCATDQPLKLPEYRYGGLGLRGNRSWDGKENCHFLTSEGETDRVKGHGTHARWCDVSGDVEGAPAGLAILGHPDNFRAPQPMRIHPDEPFFSFSPQEAGPMEISPGKPYVSRYRFVVHDGTPDRAQLDRLWNDYAHPPRAELDAAR